MPSFKRARQDGKTDFACVVCVELASVYFVSYNAANTAAIVHYCKLSQNNIAMIAWTGIVLREETRVLIRRLNNQPN
ncbi:hypothetical protein TNCV_4925841 [Trichonephila clavipes]|nr:hypothetical protein TNCV_4925841 [Trichonephila clavipes]